VGFEDRFMCLMESFTLPVTFARMSRYSQTTEGACQVQASQASCEKGWKAGCTVRFCHLPILSPSLHCPLNCPRSKTSRWFGLVKRSFIQSTVTSCFNGIDTNSVFHAQLQSWCCSFVMQSPPHQGLFPAPLPCLGYALSKIWMLFACSTIVNRTGNP